MKKKHQIMKEKNFKPVKNKLAGLGGNVSFFKTDLKLTMLQSQQLLLQVT